LSLPVSCLTRLTWHPGMCPAQCSTDDRIRRAKNTGSARLPSPQFAINPARAGHLALTAADRIA